MQTNLKWRILHWLVVLLSIFPGGKLGAATSADGFGDEQSAVLLGRLQAFLFSKARVGVIRLAGTLDDRGGDGKVRIKSTFRVDTELQGPGKLRLVEEPLAMPVEGRDNPYYLFRTTIFNGEYWARVVERQGHAGDVFDVNKAEILSDRPYECTPERFGLNYLLAYAQLRLYKTSLSEVLRTGSVNGKKLKLFEEESAAGTLLRVEIPDDYSTDTFWLVPDKGFAIYRVLHDYNKMEPEKRIVEEEIVEGFVPVAAGIWVPKEMVHRKTVGEKLQYVQKLRFISAEFSPGATMEAVTKLNLRPGCRVQDARFGITFTIGEEPEIVIEKFKQSLGK